MTEPEVFEVTPQLTFARWRVKRRKRRFARRIDFLTELVTDACLDLAGKPFTEADVQRRVEARLASGLFGVIFIGALKRIFLPVLIRIVMRKLRSMLDDPVAITDLANTISRLVLSLLDSLGHQEQYAATVLELGRSEEWGSDEDLIVELAPPIYELWEEVEPLNWDADMGLYKEL